VDINRAWEIIRENIKISAKESLDYYEMKKHKPWFNNECSKLQNGKVLIFGNNYKKSEPDSGGN
jgi:hypothetical protein